MRAWFRTRRLVLSPFVTFSWRRDFCIARDDLLIRVGSGLVGPTRKPIRRGGCTPPLLWLGVLIVFVVEKRILGPSPSSVEFVAHPRDKMCSVQV